MCVPSGVSEEGEQARPRLTGHCPGMRADMSWSTVTLESRTTYRLFLFFSSWYHEGCRLMGRIATLSFTSTVACLVPHTTVSLPHTHTHTHTLQPAASTFTAGLPRRDVEAARTSLLLDVVLVVPRVAVAVAPCPGAPAPAAVAPAASASAASPSDAPARAAAVVLAAGVGRGPHEGEVDLDGLVEQLGLVGAVDGGAGLGERGVFDQRVALLGDTSVPVSGGRVGLSARKPSVVRTLT